MATAAWKENAFNELAEIQLLPENWDGYGTPAMPPTLVEKMWALVQSLPDELAGETPAPHIYPACDGLQIEWNGDGRGLEIILETDCEASYVLEYTRHYESKYESDTVDITDLPAVLKLFERAFANPHQAAIVGGR